ncbi:hypothetical protein V2S66_31305 [Streptomyces sp. V4-01]|uniref:FtsK gamma domain-containing protein n=1 Tax=Actinacidiphila polyblastidii TaxID=3110430 RepID=A0ABU7PMG2_9ACTN|nr:hypothetical protein [Streptomyces sp. V4-01]
MTGLVSVKIRALKLASAAVGVAGVATFRAPAAEWKLLDQAVWLWIESHPDCTVGSIMGGVRLSYLRAIEALGHLRAQGRITAFMPPQEGAARPELTYRVAVPPVPPEDRDRSPFLPRYGSDEEVSDG